MASRDNVGKCFGPVCNILLWHSICCGWLPCNLVTGQGHFLCVQLSLSWLLYMYSCILNIGCSNRPLGWF